MKNKRNVENEAARKEILNLRSKVSGLRFNCEENEKSFKILEKDFVDSWTEVLELKDTMARKTSEFKSSNAKKDNHISPLEAKLKRANEEHKAEVPR